MRLWVNGVLVCLLGWAGLAHAAEAPKVVASLKPIHALAAAVMEGVAVPRLIVEGAASEHAYAMKPSDAAALESADAVIWVGPVMESYLVRPIAALPRHARIVTLIDRTELTRLRRRAGGAFDADHHAPSGAVFDGHLWLDPQNAILIGAAIAETLSGLDPDHAARYAANAARLKSDLEVLDAALKARLVPLRDKPFIVFHDAYHYFEARYGLKVAGSITVEPGLAPSAQRVAEIRTRIKREGVACVFAEPQFEPRLLPVLIEGTAARTGVLDPLGAALPPGRDAYFALMRNLAGGLEACFAR